jgi:hypothetical protein
MAKAITLRCDKGHVQRIEFTPEMGEAEAHDFGVLLCGGVLKSIGREMPGYPCQWSKDGAPPCGGKVSFEVEP